MNIKDPPIFSPPMQAIKTTSFHFLVSPSNRFKAAQSQSRKSVNSLKVFSFHSSCSIDVLITSEALSVLWLPTHSLYLLIFSSAHLIANNYYSNTPIALNGVVCLPNDLEFGRILFWFFVVDGERRPFRSWHNRRLYGGNETKKQKHGKIIEAPSRSEPEQTS